MLEEHGRHGYSHVVCPETVRMNDSRRVRPAGGEHVVRNDEWTGFTRRDRPPNRHLATVG